jgi:hypothetical protein
MPQPALIKPDTDSLVPVRPVYPHIFEGHSLQKLHTEELKHEQDVPAWPALILFLPVVLLVYLYVSYFRKLNALFRAFFSLKAARQIGREDYRVTRRPSLILSFVYLVSLSFFLHQYNQYHKIVSLDFPPVVQFHLVFAGVILLYTVKLTANSILGFIMDAGAEVREYNFNIFLSAQGAGLFLLPLSFCIQYLRYPRDSFFVVGFVIYALFYVLRLVKGVQIGMERRNFSAFHLFLYLCALEILPLIVLITFLMRLNS